MKRKVEKYQTSYIDTYSSVCARDRPERGCKKHITMVKLEIDLITYER